MSTEEPDPLYDFCRSLPGVTDDIKWETNLVFSVGDKMFAAFNFPRGEPFSFKADPHVFADLTQRPGIQPAPYLGKHLWVSLSRRNILPLDHTRELLSEAHTIVAYKLSRKKRESLGIE